MITLAILQAISPKGSRPIMAAIAPAMEIQCPLVGITSKLRMAHFLAQAAEESDGFKVLIEYASGRAYEGRKDLGNTEPGDGVRFKGRGLFQLTGRANYRLIGDKLGLPLVEHPEIAAEPDNAVRIACEYWRSHNLNPLADADDIRGITRKVNGGYRGLDVRKIYLAMAKKALGGP